MRTLAPARWILIALVALLPLSARAAEPAPGAEPAAKQVTCPACEGSGEGACAVPGCRAGKAPCDQPCLKKTDAWEKMKNPENPQVQMWLKVYTPDRLTYKLFPQTAMGHVIDYTSGTPKDGGICPACKGVGVGECKSCAGTGKGHCVVCKKNGTIAEPLAKEWIAKRDEERAERAFTLKDGRIIFGKAVMRTPTAVTIKTDDGEKIDVAPDQIVSEPQPKKKGKPAEPKK